jgi:hypothetical protein
VEGASGVEMVPMRYPVRENRLLWGRSLRPYSVTIVGMTGFEPATRWAPVFVFALRLDLSRLWHQLFE